MISTDTLIHDLSAGLAPVRRRSMGRETIALLAVGVAELLFILMGGLMRSDMGRVILSTFMVWKLGSLVLLAGVSCTVAMRSFAPPTSSRRSLALVFGLAALAMVGGSFVTSAADSGRPLIERLAPTHGLHCAISIVILALPLMALFAVLMRRAAPIHPGRSALATGLAASTCGALLFAVCCPANDPLYVVVWYSVGSAVITAAARWLLPQRFRL